MSKWLEPIIGKRITYKYNKEGFFYSDRERKGIVLTDTETFICVWHGIVVNIVTEEDQEVTEMIMKEDFFITDIEELTDEEMLTHDSLTVRRIGMERIKARKVCCA